MTKLFDHLIKRLEVMDIQRFGSFRLFLNMMVNKSSLFKSLKDLLNLKFYLSIYTLFCVLDLL